MLKCASQFLVAKRRGDISKVNPGPDVCQIWPPERAGGCGSMCQIWPPEREQEDAGGCVWVGVCVCGYVSASGGMCVRWCVCVCVCVWAPKREQEDVVECVRSGPRRESRRKRN